MVTLALRLTIKELLQYLSASEKRNRKNRLSYGNQFYTYRRYP